jgi:ketosteroid isomerase-like protein
MHGVFGEVYNAGTIDDLVALYEPDAFLVPQLGQRVIGLSAIRESLVGFVNLKGTACSRKEPDGSRLIVVAMPLPTPETSSFPFKIVC